MAAVSAWGKPGSWALEAESHDDATATAAEELKDTPPAPAPSADFPSLAAALATKPSKKKKPQTLSLAKFATSNDNKAAAFKEVGLTQDELRALPTGPRERTPEELERASSRGFSYSSYGSSRDGRPSREESSRGWGGSSRVSDERRNDSSDRVDSGPSRADEIDDWGAAKRSAPPPMSERRERGGGFFDSQSRADESDSWISRKPAPPPPSAGRRVNGGGFDGPRERRGGLDKFNREGFNGDGVDSETWGRKREEPTSGTGGRPRLSLQPRTLPLANDNGEHATAKSKGNPFGEARPREEVLAEKGQDWKKIDEKLESMTIRVVPEEDAGFGKKGRGMGNGGSDDRIEKSWRKADAVDAPPTPPRVEKIDEILTDN